MLEIFFFCGNGEQKISLVKRHPIICFLTKNKSKLKGKSQNIPTSAMSSAYISKIENICLGNLCLCVFINSPWFLIAAISLLCSSLVIVNDRSNNS